MEVSFQWRCSSVSCLVSNNLNVWFFSKNPNALVKLEKPCMKSLLNEMGFSTKIPLKMFLGNLVAMVYLLGDPFSSIVYFLSFR